MLWCLVTATWKLKWDWALPEKCQCTICFSLEFPSLQLSNPLSFSKMEPWVQLEVKHSLRLKGSELFSLSRYSWGPVSARQQGELFKWWSLEPKRIATCGQQPNSEHWHCDRGNPQAGACVRWWLHSAYREACPGSTPIKNYSRMASKFLGTEKNMFKICVFT